MGQGIKQEYLIPFRPPTVNTYWRRSGKNIHLSEKGTAFKRNVKLFMRTQKNKKISDKPLAVDLILNFKGKTKRDIDNYCKGILDSLTGILWEDDSQIIKLNIEKNIGEKEDNFILRVQEVDSQRGA